MKKHKAFAAMLSVMAISLLSVNTRADTDGTELQVVEPSQLTIQLGEAWAGVEFELRTDSGVYPGTVTVDEHGILSLEIGGSSVYELSCLTSTQKAPSPEPESSESPAAVESTAATEPVTQQIDDDSDEPTVYGIPVVHLAVFGGGMLVAIVFLITLQFSRRRRRRWDEYDEDDNEPSD